MENKVILLVVENRDDIRTDYARLLVSIAWTKMVYGFHFWDGGRRAIWHMRQEMIKAVLTEERYKGATHILFLDTDVIPRPSDGNFVQKLLEDLDKGWDAISGYYCNTNGNPINRRNGVTFLANEGIYELDVLSMGYSLWKIDIFKNVEYPMPEPAYKLDADAEFCKAVKEKGYKIGCDFSLRGQHELVGTF